ncbi:NUDIX domain-containing protein [Bdellovibrio bacteriovorus]|uniref:NUDIX domain-containing protein n=1 Tax=Bdellovibrio TaxID=958 RepID=UPI0035A953EC
MSTQIAKRFSSGIVPIYKSDHEILFLLLRSYNYWDFPKGEVEKNEDPFIAARRELQEETGIDKVQFHFGEIYKETPPYSQGKIARYYIGEVKTKNVTLGVNEELGRPEHQEYRWVNYKDAKLLLGDRVAAILEWAYSIEKNSASR